MPLLPWPICNRFWCRSTGRWRCRLTSHPREVGSKAERSTGVCEQSQNFCFHLKLCTQQGARDAGKRVHVTASTGFGHSWRSSRALGSCQSFCSRLTVAVLWQTTSLLTSNRNSHAPSIAITVWYRYRECEPDGTICWKPPRDQWRLTWLSQESRSVKKTVHP